MRNQYSEHIFMPVPANLSQRWKAELTTPGLADWSSYYITRITQGVFYIYINLAILPLYTELWNDKSCMNKAWYRCQGKGQPELTIEQFLYISVLTWAECQCRGDSVTRRRSMWGRYTAAAGRGRLDARRTASWTPHCPGSSSSHLTQPAA